MMQSNKKCSVVWDFFNEKFLDDSKAVVFAFDECEF